MEQENLNGEQSLAEDVVAQCLGREQANEAAPKGMPRLVESHRRCLA